MVEVEGVSEALSPVPFQSQGQLVHGAPGEGKPCVPSGWAVSGGIGPESRPRLLDQSLTADSWSWLQRKRLAETSSPGPSSGGTRGQQGPGSRLWSPLVLTRCLCSQEGEVRPLSSRLSSGSEQAGLSGLRAQRGSSSLRLAT